MSTDIAPTAEHIKEARRALLVANHHPRCQCSGCERVDEVAPFIAAAEARGFERGRAAGPALDVDPLAGNRHHKDGAHALPVVLFTLSVEPLPCSRCGFNGVPGTTHSTSCLYPDPR